MVNKVIDIEEFCQNDKKVPKGQHYKIKVDREKYIVDSECKKGKDILKIADKTPYERYQLNQKLKGGEVRKIDYEEDVCFTNPGIERFMTLPLDQTEG
jgi:hypothetical protein